MPKSEANWEFSPHRSKRLCEFYLNAKKHMKESEGKSPEEIWYKLMVILIDLELATFGEPDSLSEIREYIIALT